MKMENLKIKERNIVMGTQNGKITFIPQQGIVADNKKGVTAFFKFGEDVREQLVFPYTVERHRIRHKKNEGKYYSLYMFFDESFRVWTGKGLTKISGFGCYKSFIFKGYELIGMNLERFLQLNLFLLDYIDEDYYSVAPGINFRHYKVYYNLAFQLSIYIWRKKIRVVLVCGFFFEKKMYEDPDYLEIFKLKKIED